MAVIDEAPQVDLDLSLPIATLLRSGTAAAHQTAETSAGAGWLTRGELDKEEYIRFLIMLWHVYDELERALEQHASNPVLSPTYNPTLLARAPALLADISHLLAVPPSDVPSHPLFTALGAPAPRGLAEYTARLRALASARDPAPLLAHAYVRYLGDLSGGQVIRRRVARAYGLEDDGGAGVSFYEFSKLGGGAGATVGDMKKIKEWYRDGMNAGVGDDRDLKVTILAEANKAFVLNGGLFESLKPPSSPPSSPPSPVDSASPHAHFGNPNTPAVASFPHEEEKPKEIAVQILQTHSESEGTYSVSGVLSFIAAMCLAHFILVVGGFTGTRGWEKLQAVENWISGYLH